MKPVKIKDVGKFIKELNDLYFISVGIITSYPKFECIIRKKTKSKLSVFFDLNWIGQVLYDKSEKKYYFCTTKSDHLGKINDIYQLKEVLNCISENMVEE